MMDGTMITFWITMVLLMTAHMEEAADLSRNPVRVDFLTILNERNFQADQQIFARILNQKNAELTRAGAPFSLHSTELMAKTTGISQQIKDVCNAADASSGNWMTIVNLAEPTSVFVSAMVGQQMSLPVLGYVSTFEPEMYRDVSPDFYIALNPSSLQVAQAVGEFIKTQRWHMITSVIADSSPSGVLFHQELARRISVQQLSVLTATSTEAEIREKLSKLKESKSRVQILFCEANLAQSIFRQAKKLNLIGTGWVWIITDRSYTTSDDLLEDYPVGSFAVKIRESALTQIVRTALDTMAHAISRLAVTPNLISRLQDKQSRKANCWNEGEDGQSDTASKIPRDLKAGLKNYTKEMRLFLEGPTSTKDRFLFEILGLSVKKTRNRWSRIGNISSIGAHTPAIVWASEKLSDSLADSRGRLRVVTRIVHPFTIEDYPFTEDGTCLQGVPCLRIASKKKEEIRDIFASFETGLRTGSSYNFTCCIGLAMDLLQALSRDVGFDFDTYLVADDKDGTELESDNWDGIMGDLKSGAAHMGVGPISVTRARKSAVDFSSPFYYSKFSFLVATTKAKVKLSAFLEPFSWKLWIAIFSALHATAIAAAIFEWVSPFGLNPTGRMRSQNFTLATALTTVYSLFFSHVFSFKAPKSWPNKVLINFWGSFCFIILASYTANHAAIYAGLSQKPNFDNIFDNEDLLGRKVATIKGSSAEVFIRNINAQLHDHMDKHQFFNVVSVEGAVERLKSGSLDAFVYDTALLDYVQANDTGCMLKTAGAAFGSQGYAVAFPKRSWLRTPVSLAVLKYMETGFVDDLSAKWFGGLQCKGRATLDTLEPRPLGLEDFAGVFVLLSVGAGIGLLILGLEHVVYRALPRLRRAPKTSMWHSRHVMFFSQKLYRFINSVDLVSPNSSAKEFASSIKQGQFIGMFQKSVKKREKEEALQQKRNRNADNFFETIHELTRNIRESSVPPQSSNDTVEEEPKSLQDGNNVNGDVAQPILTSKLPKSGLSASRSKKHNKGPKSSQKLNRQNRITEDEDADDSVDSIPAFAHSFPEFPRLNKPNKPVTPSSLKEFQVAPRKRVWIAQDALAADRLKNGSDEDNSSPTSPLNNNPVHVATSPLDELHPYTSLRDWDDVDIEDVSKQDLIKMWQSAECDLRLQIQKLAKEKSQLLDRIDAQEETPGPLRPQKSPKLPASVHFNKKSTSMNL